MKFAYLGLGAALLLFGCNLFDPSDDVSVDTSDASMMTYEGQNCFRNSEYANAANFFKQAIQKDSTLSEAWLGLSKANLYLYAGNPYDLIHELYADTDIPLMNLDSSEVAKYFKAVNSSLIPLRELIRRDTLTEQDPSLKLSDRSVTYSNFSASHAILELAYTILRFRYTNSSFIKISINEDRSLSFDLQSLYDQALLDPAVLAQFNASVDSLKGDLTQLLDAVLPAASSSLSNSDLFEIDDSTGKAQILGDDLQSDAETVEKSVSFYKLGDGIDNDGDGCVDEEILDGYDNDGDGYYDLQHSEGYDKGSWDVGGDAFYWQDHMGDLEYIRQACRLARKYGPEDIVLFINDYNLESDWDNNKKLKSLINWIKKWEADGVTKIDGIGTQMHISCFENNTHLNNIKKHITQMFQLMANSGKLVRVSELDMGYVRGSDRWAPSSKTDELTEAEHKKMADFYEWIIKEYFRIIPADQQWGICQWCTNDAPANSGWRGGEPVGIWDLNYYRKHVYAGFVRGLNGGEPSGFHGIEADNDIDISKGIYNMQGVRMSATSLHALPCGIYIVDGKKVVVK